MKTLKQKTFKGYKFNQNFKIISEVKIFNKNNQS